MRRTWLTLLVCLLGVALVSPAQAAVRFHSGPTATDKGTTLQVTGNVSGLGNQDLDVYVTATGVADVTCTNPAGNVAPGQRTTVDVLGQTTGIEPKNGRATFSVTTQEPAAPTRACPNAKWTASITDVHFTSATLRLEQGGQVIYDGAVPVT